MIETGDHGVMSSSDTLTDGTVFVDPAGFANEEAWHRTVTEVRKATPALRCELPGWPRFWAITRHADVVEIERRHDIFRNTKAVALMSDDQVRANEERDASMETILHMDDPKHRKYRGITTDWFKASALRKTMGGKVDALAQEYVDAMVAMGGVCDFATDVALHLPLRVIMARIPSTRTPKNTPRTTLPQSSRSLGSFRH